MKRKKHHVISLAALLMAGAAMMFTACSGSEDNDIIEPASAQPANGKYTLTVNASKGGASREQNGIRSSSAEAQPALGKAKAVDATTRALSLDGNTLNATWKEGEKVTVLKLETNIMNPQGYWTVLGQLTVGNVRDGGLTCSLTGEFGEGTLGEGDKLRLVFPGKDSDTYWMTYTNQKGGLNWIASQYDYCSTPDDKSQAVRVTAVNGTNVTTSDATFTNNQAIVRFTFMDGNDYAVNPTSLTISAKDSYGQEKMITEKQITGIGISTTPTALNLLSDGMTNVVYAAIPGFSNMNITLTATVGSKTYIYKKSDVTFENGKYYAITVKMKKLGKVLSEVAKSDLGKIIGADGRIYDNAAAANDVGTTAVAVITYVDSDAETNTTYRRGLALALEDAGSAMWCSQTDATCLATQCTTVEEILEDIAGIANTDALVGHATHTHNAAALARNYNNGTHPTGTSAWFLPSSGQLNKMYGAMSINGDDLINVLQGAYWTSTEYDKEKAWYNKFVDSNSFLVEVAKDASCSVRAALAF